MRTTVEENAAMGRWIGERLNQMTGPVRFFLPEKGVSLLDQPGQAFHDPAADAALFGALEATVIPASDRQLIRLPYNVNDAEFVAEIVRTFHELQGNGRRQVQEARPSNRSRMTQWALAIAFGSRAGVELELRGESLEDFAQHPDPNASTS